MDATLSQQRILPAITASAVGIAVSALIHSPFGLLAPIAALFVLAGGRTGLLLHVASAAGLAVSLLVAAFYDGDARELAVLWAGFFALAMSIGALVATRGSASPGADALAATRSMTRGETQPDRALGPALKVKVAPRSSPRVSIAAADDQATAKRMVAASFWGGTAFHVRYWRRLTDGSQRWTEIRTEPLHQPGGTQRWRGISADLDDPEPRPQQPAQTACNPPNDDDAVRAAKVVERLLGNAWAFDAGGRPTYLTPIAQTFVAVTLEEFQAAVDEGHTVFKCTSDPDDYERIASAWRHSLQTGDPFYIERRIRRATGILDWSRTAIVPTRDSHGRITGWYGGSIDLDVYRHAEAELRDRERELSHLVAMVPSHICRLTRDGEPTFFNKRMVDFLGLDVADMAKPGMSRLAAAIATTLHPDDAAGFAEALDRSLVTGEPLFRKYRLRRADGVYRWVEGRIEPLRDHDGVIVQWYGVAFDVDDQMRAEDALRRSERELQQLVDALPVHVWSWTPDGKLAYVNKRSLEELGLSGASSEDRTRVAQDLVHPEDASKVLRTSAKCLKTGDAFIMRYRRRWKDGTYRWIEGRCEPLRDRDGAIVHWYQVSLDIDEEMRAQDALRRSERQLQQLVDAVPVMIWSTTREGKPSYVNKRFTDVTGATLEDISAPDGSFNLSVIHPDDKAVTAEMVGRSFRAGLPYVMQYRQLRGDGSYRWTETRAEALRDHAGNVLQWYGVSVDIHDLVTAQEALRDRERELSQLVDMVPVHIRRLTPQGEPTFFNKRLMDFFGMGDVADLDRPGMSRLAAIIQTLVHPDDAARLLETARHSFAAGDPFSMRYRMCRADGAYRWVDTRAEPLRNQSGAIVQWYVVSLDIDDEMRAQQALRDRERELSQLVDMLPIHIRRLTPGGETIFLNQRLVDFVGVDLAELRKRGTSGLIQTLVHPDDAANLEETIRHALATGEAYTTRYRVRRADGVYRWMEGRGEPVRDQTGTIVQWYWISIDIDDAVRAQQAEEALRDSSDKLAKATQAASLAELSASIAHEVNQPLAAIVANSHACQRWLSGEPANVERAKLTVERVIRDANSAADVVSRIRALFRQSVEPRHNTSLSGVIAEARNLTAEDAARRRVRVEIDVENDLPLVAFDRVQIQQVLINLIRNGFDAMESAPGDRVLGMRARRNGNSIQTEISDLGAGIAFPERIFEAFFTTKPSGMGMGLAICRSIVESHGGRLWAEKNEPRGARFIFTLPIDMRSAP